MSGESGKLTMEVFHVAAKKAGLDYLLIGGFAASFWGKPRFTGDVDYVVESSCLEVVTKVMESLNYKLAFLHPKKNFAHFQPADAAGLRIDFMFVDKSTWDKLHSSQKNANFGGSSNYPIVDHLHLISMKLHAAKQDDREDFFKDLNDIVEIMLAQNLDYSELEKTGIIKKHGTEKTTSLLKDLLQARIDRQPK